MYNSGSIWLKNTPVSFGTSPAKGPVNLMQGIWTKAYSLQQHVLWLFKNIRCFQERWDLTDQDLNNLALKIPNEVIESFVGSYLGIGTSTIDSLHTKHRENIHRISVDILSRWKNTNTLEHNRQASVNKNTETQQIYKSLLSLFCQSYISERNMPSSNKVCQQKGRAPPTITLRDHHHVITRYCHMT